MKQIEHSKLMKRALSMGKAGIVVGLLVATTNAANASDGSTSATSPSNATQGYFVCQAYMRERNKVFYSMPFAGNSNRATELALAYAQMLREKGYATASAYAPAGTPPPQLDVFCHWHSTEALATKFKDNLLRGAGDNMTTVPTTFDPV